MIEIAIRRRKAPRRKTCYNRERKPKPKLTEKAAKEHAKSLRERGALVQAYECLYDCKLEDGSKAWHIGHKHYYK